MVMTDTNDQRQVQRTTADDEALISELCATNGLNPTKLAQEGPQCPKLEMFFFGYDRLVGLQHFPNLQVLSVVGQMIDRIKGLTQVPLLTELWIAECQLRKIEGLEHLTKLKKLYLYANEIERIENLNTLTSLEVLWLNENQIYSLEGLSALQELTELNMAENKISLIGPHLGGLQKLKKLELSGNNICHLKDLTKLARLGSLRELGLKSPVYQPNPVTQLCNYHTHVVYHMPLLTRLDTFDVSHKGIADMAKTTVQKKKMYYNTKLKMVQRQMDDMQRQLRRHLEGLLRMPLDKQRSLHYLIKEIDRELADLEKTHGDVKSKQRDTESDEQSDDSDRAVTARLSDNSAAAAFRKKQAALHERIAEWESRCNEMEDHYQLAIQQLNSVTDATIQRLSIELETCGNVKFEEGKVSDAWYKACHDLVLSRFCTTDYRDSGIVGMKVHRIIRCYNRMLKMRFDERLNIKCGNDDEEGYSITYKADTESKKSMDYLFWIWDHEQLGGGSTNFNKILEEGFMDAYDLLQLSKDGGVALTNSVRLAEKPRIEFLTNQHKDKSKGIVRFECGQLLICKVYLGETAQCLKNSKQIVQKDYASADSVCVTSEKMEGVSDSGEAPPPTQCECQQRRASWYVFDNSFVVPEYIVDFEYLTNLVPGSPFPSHPFGPLGATWTRADHWPQDDDVINMEPAIKSRPRLACLSEDVILKTLRVQSLMQISVLNLHGNSLTKLKCLQGMTLLRKLIISFNEMTRLDDLAHMHLESLDASFNKITTLDGFKGMSRLKHFNVSWNRLQNVREDISILHKHTQSLTHLDMRHNPWFKEEGMRLRVIARIKSLVELNGTPVVDTEMTGAMRLAAASRVQIVALLTHARTDGARPRTLCMLPVAQILQRTSRRKPEPSGELDSLWMSTVTSVCLDGQHIGKLTNLERLENLRWASFSDNNITKIEGLDNCTKLEELNLEHNCISRLDGLTSLVSLKQLRLGHNNIASIEGSGLDKLSSLTYLSLECNQLTTLFGFQRLLSLVELYISNNAIESMREIFFLKALTNLQIVDQLGNPMCEKADNYRLFSIYHLNGLKALDGIEIEGNEINQARDTFGGRLTHDFIAEKLGHSNFRDLQELDFPNCSIRSIDLGNGEQFPQLRSINLQNNNLLSTSGLMSITTLRVLCLNNNHIECLVPRNKSMSLPVKSKVGSLPPQQQALPATLEPLRPMLENLEVLHLAYNGIKDMAVLQLRRLPALKALFLQGNEISRVEGLDGLENLRELILDKNKIKSVGETSFSGLVRLQELHMEENRLRDLTNFSALPNLQRLYLGLNKIQDINELDKLEPLKKLTELSLIGNGVVRKMLHRPILIYRMPSLTVIDGLPVCEEERMKAEFYFSEQDVSPLPQGPDLVVMKSAVPMRVTNVQLNLPIFDRFGPSPFQLVTDDGNAKKARGPANSRSESNSTLTTLPSMPVRQVAAADQGRLQGRPVGSQSTTSYTQQRNGRR